MLSGMILSVMKLVDISTPPMYLAFGVEIGLLKQVLIFLQHS